MRRRESINLLFSVNYQFLFCDSYLKVCRSLSAPWGALINFCIVVMLLSMWNVSVLINMRGCLMLPGMSGSSLSVYIHESRITPTLRDRKKISYIRPKFILWKSNFGTYLNLGSLYSVSKEEAPPNEWPIITALSKLRRP